MLNLLCFLLLCVCVCWLLFFCCCTFCVMCCMCLPFVLFYLSFVVVLLCSVCILCLCVVVFVCCVQCVDTYNLTHIFNHTRLGLYKLSLHFGVPLYIFRILFIQLHWLRVIPGLLCLRRNMHFTSTYTVLLVCHYVQPLLPIRNIPLPVIHNMTTAMPYSTSQYVWIRNTCR